MATDEKLEARQNANMLRQMENNIENIEDEKSIGFADFSFDNYRQLLQDMLNEKKNDLRNLPNGVFSGFCIEKDPVMKNGLIALLGYPSRKKYDPLHQYTSHELVYIDLEGNQISNNQKIILEQLLQYHKETRCVDSKIDSGDEQTILKLRDSIQKWIKSQAKNEEVQNDGNIKETMSQTTLELLDQIKKGNVQSIQKLKTEGSISEKFVFENFDLITWLIVS